MPAWVEDAHRRLSSETASSQSSVLLRTTEVEEFLSNENLSSHALVAPKRVREDLRAEVETRFAAGVTIIAGFVLATVDRLSNKPPILPNEIINVLESSDTGETLWNIAFSIWPDLAGSRTIATFTSSLRELQEFGKICRRRC